MGPTVNTRILTECPRCGALPGDRCWKLSSWISTGLAGKGFYTERMDGFHVERRRPPSASAGKTPKNALRQEIGRLVMTKLSGTDRVQARRWANLVTRTEDELREYRDKLIAMGDIAW
jgi:hypothetical protein